MTQTADKTTRTTAIDGQPVGKTATARYLTGATFSARPSASARARRQNGRVSTTDRGIPPYGDTV